MTDVACMEMMGGVSCGGCHGCGPCGLPLHKRQVGVTHNSSRFEIRSQIPPFAC